MIAPTWPMKSSERTIFMQKLLIRQCCLTLVSYILHVLQQCMHTVFFAFLCCIFEGNGSTVLCDDRPTKIKLGNKNPLSCVYLVTFKLSQIDLARQWHLTFFCYPTGISSIWNANLSRRLSFSSANH
jgi:hypothetical protein